MFYIHNGMKLEINNRDVGNLTNMWKLNNTSLSKQWVKSKPERKFENTFT